jgi:hypothetical protein
MKPQKFVKILAAVAVFTALAGVATAATMVKGTMTKGTMTMPSPPPVMKPMM